MTTIGLIGTGAMGSAIGAGWRESGASVITSLAGRSARTRAMAVDAGIEVVEDVVGQSDIVVSVVPPGRAIAVAETITAGAATAKPPPLVVDLNAVAPVTIDRIGTALASAGCDLVDGSISGGPPRSSDRPVRVYLSGPRAAELARVPNARLDIVVLDGPAGAASALKMCTASMYKGTNALIMQALLTADAHGVRDEFLADTARARPDEVPRWHLDVAIAATKAWRFVDEMREIALTQAGVGLPAELFGGVAAAYDRAAATELGRTAPEDVDPDLTVDAVVRMLRPTASVEGT